jgi:Cof subfamily protein (haloacid dehalogenase superfamily)
MDVRRRPQTFEEVVALGETAAAAGAADAPAVERVELAEPIRLVAIDLDGTLLNDSKQVSEQTMMAVAGLGERGVRVVIATARPPRSVRQIYHQLGLDTLQINYNGALIWDEPRGEAMFHRPMAGALVRELIGVARQTYADTLVSCEVMDRWYTDRHDPQYTTETGRLFKPDVICGVDEMCDQTITKLMFLGHPELMTALEPVLVPFGDRVTVVRADSDLIQVMDRRVSKGVALTKIAEHYGIDTRQVMAIGDAPNDVGMLKAAGVAIAMDNAHEQVKKVAHWVAPSNNDHGVHAALARYGVCE